MPNLAEVSAPPKIPGEVLAVAERVGEFIEYWGFRKIEGKIWAVIFLSAEPRDMAYLCAELKVSKALVSLAVTRLLEFKVIRLAYPDRQRYQAYEANPNVLEVIFNVLRSRERTMLSRVESAVAGLERLPTKGLQQSGYSGARLKFLHKMVRLAARLMDSALALKNWNLSHLKQIALADRV